MLEAQHLADRVVSSAQMFMAFRFLRYHTIDLVKLSE